MPEYLVIIAAIYIGMLVILTFVKLIEYDGGSNITLAEVISSVLLWPFWLLVMFIIGIVRMWRKMA